MTFRIRLVQFYARAIVFTDIIARGANKTKPLLIRAEAVCLCEFDARNANELIKLSVVTKKALIILVTFKAAS